jgi:hypothetical protein
MGFMRDPFGDEDLDSEDPGQMGKSRVNAATRCSQTR